MRRVRATFEVLLQIDDLYESKGEPVEPLTRKMIRDALRLDLGGTKIRIGGIMQLPEREKE